MYIYQQSLCRYSLVSIIIKLCSMKVREYCYARKYCYANIPDPLWDTNPLMEIWLKIYFFDLWKSSYFTYMKKLRVMS